MHVWLDTTPRDGASQMAIDCALLDIARDEQVAVLRLYRWAVTTLSFGAHEAARRTWARPAIEAAKLPTVRRPTGGRAVLHDASDLTYAVTQPLASHRPARAAYRSIHEGLAFALAAAGVTATLAPPPGRHPGIAGGACFDAAMGGELMVGGQKCVGSAQLVRGGALLQHGAIAAADPLARLARFAQEAPVAVSTGAYIVLPEATVIADAISSHWIRNGATPAPHDLVRRALDRSVEHATLFSSNEWTWRR